MLRAIRRLRHAPGFTLVVVVTLALGIGANTAIFSAVRGLLLRPVPYRQPGRLVFPDLIALDGFGSGSGPDTVPYWSGPSFDLLRQQTAGVMQVAGFAALQQNLTGTDAPERLSVELVSADYFTLLGVAPAAGRTFAPDEDAVPGQPSLAVISYGLWQRRYGGQADAVDGTIQLDKRSYRIIGVAPRGFRGLSGGVDAWVPLSMAPVVAWGPDALQDPWSLWFGVVGRLRDGVTLARARSAAALVGARMFAAHPWPFGGGQLRGTATLVPVNAARVHPLVRRAALVLLGAVVFVLLIAMVNVANLQLARGAERARELAIRRALGAGRMRLIQEQLTENLILALAGGGVGLLLALWGADLVRGLSTGVDLRLSVTTAQLEGAGSIRPDAVVLLFTLGLALAVGILFGLWPALRGSRQAPVMAMREGGRAGWGRKTSRGRATLVVAEVALALVLLVGAGLMLRSFALLSTVRRGFRADHVLTFRVDPTAAAGQTVDWPTFTHQLTNTLSAQPGVQTAGMARCAPLTGGCNVSVVTRVDDHRYQPGEQSQIGVNYADAGFFGALSIPLLSGRLFDAGDRPGRPKVVVINESAARAFFPDTDPIGRRIGIAVGFLDWPNWETAEIVGVVGDVRYVSPETPARPTAYIPLSQYSSGSYVFVRSAGDPLALVSILRRAVTDMDPDLPIYDVRTMADRASDSTARSRVLTRLLGAFGGLALLLAVIGLYGVLSYTVGHRVREIGIRMALGARAGEVLRGVVLEGLRLTVTGLALGLAAALALARVLRGLLFLVPTTDAATIVAVSAALALAALFAAYLPAHRAAHTDPMTVLRQE